MMLSRLVLWLLSCFILVGAGMPFAQEYPTKSIRIITGPVGGGNDAASRLIAQGISGPLGQQVIVENRASALVAEIFAKAPPDGYVLMVQGGTIWITPLLQKVNYDMSDFSPITLISRGLFILAVHPSLPVRSVKELIALAKMRPGEINYSVGTPGGSTTLAGALLQSLTGTKMVAIPYAGNGPILTAVVSGEVQFTILDPGSIMPQVKAGRLRALAVTTATPSALVPGLPTMAASGVPGYEAAGMMVLYAPLKTSTSVIDRLNQEVVRYLNRQDVKERFLVAGSEIVAGSPDQLAATVKTDTARWAKVIKDVGIKAE